MNKSFKSRRRCQFNQMNTRKDMSIAEKDHRPC